MEEAGFDIGPDSGFEGVQLTVAVFYRAVRKDCVRPS